MTESFSEIFHVVERCRDGISTHVRAAMQRQRASGRFSRVTLVADLDYADPALLDAADRVFPYLSGRNPFDILSAMKEIRCLIVTEKPAIVHLHSTFPGLYGLWRNSGAASAPAIVYCAHGWSFEMELPSWKRWIYVKIEKRLALQADVTLSLSEVGKREALACGLPSEGHITIPQGVAPADVLPPPKEMEGDGLKLLFFGRFDRQKGLDILLSAFKRVRRTDVTLHLVGEAEYADESRLDLSDPRIRRHGWVPHMELNGWLAAADALIVPSRWEGAPLVVLEAMRNRTALIASSHSAMPEMLDQGAAGMLFPLDKPDQLTTIIESLEPEALTALGDVGFAHYQGNYMLEHAGAALDVAYETALARRRERG